MKRILLWLSRPLLLLILWCSVFCYAAITRYDCDFGATNGICDYAQDTDDNFNWTGQRSSTSGNSAPSETFVCACKQGQQQLARGSTARFRSGIFPATGDSMVTVSFWFRINQADGAEMLISILNHGSTRDKRALFKKTGDGADWTMVSFNETVSEPFQGYVCPPQLAEDKHNDARFNHVIVVSQSVFIFEAKIGDAINSGVALSNLSFTVFSPPKIEEEEDPTTEWTTPITSVARNMSNETTMNPSDQRPSLTFLVAVVASSTVVVIMILFVVVVVCLVRKIRVLSSTAHPYEEISSNKSERGTMEPQHQKELLINDNGSTIMTLPRWKRFSYLESNRSSIYAEITEAEERSRFHRSNTGTTGDSFVTAYSLQNILDRAAAASTTATTKSVNTSRRHSDSGWVDNVIYESGSDLRELTPSEKTGPTYRRFTGPGNFGLGGMSAGWIEDLSRSRTL